MNLVAKIGQMLVYGWKGDQPDESRAINGHARALIEEFQVGGIIIMSRNVEHIDSGRSSGAYRGVSGDVAGGRSAAAVRRGRPGGRASLRRFTPPHFAAYPTPWVQGCRAATATSPCVTARGIGNEMGSVGVNWVLAPVLDVNCNPNNPIIGDRSFGADPALVAAMGVGAVQGYQDDSGVLACGKHFPGHGDTDIDSHLALPRISHTIERLEEVEFVPFRAAIGAGLGSIMTTHILFDALDPQLPATLSSAVLTGLLARRCMGF